ncbi:unnamed protein product [Amoebophrya sp. A25]|nr:unnamed protein product [Amoebophrya sp. A25]|eukprot:GSA25T00002814001.1
MLPKKVSPLLTPADPCFGLMICVFTFFSLLFTH